MIDLLNPPTTLAVVVTEPYEILDRDLPTASWYDRHQVKVGTYPVEFVTAGFEPYRPGVTPIGYVRPINAYYARWRLDTVLTETYRVNRLFTASSVEQEYPNTDSRYGVVVYAYRVEQMLQDGRMVDLARV